MISHPFAIGLRESSGWKSGGLGLSEGHQPRRLSSRSLSMIRLLLVMGLFGAARSQVGATSPLLR